MQSRLVKFLCGRLKNLTHLILYSVRHNFGTEMANEGMPLPALANLLGHRDVKMTMRYYSMNRKTIDKARDILNRRAVVNT